MADTHDIVSLIGDKAERGGFQMFSISQQREWLAKEGDTQETVIYRELAGHHNRAWYSPFGIISLQTIIADNQTSLSSQVHEAESYLDRLLASRETPGKVMDGYLILDVTYLSAELRDIACRMEQNTRLVRKHCIWESDNWQRVDRISVLALSIDRICTSTERPPEMDEAGQALVEELELAPAKKVATLHAAEWDDSHV